MKRLVCPGRERMPPSFAPSRASKNTCIGETPWVPLYYGSALGWHPKSLLPSAEKHPQRLWCGRSLVFSPGCGQTAKKGSRDINSVRGCTRLGSTTQLVSGGELSCKKQQDHRSDRMPFSKAVLEKRVQNPSSAALQLGACMVRKHSPALFYRKTKKANTPSSSQYQQTGRNLQPRPHTGQNGCCTDLAVGAP